MKNETVKLGFIRPGRPCKSLKLSRNRGTGVEHTKRRRVARACASTRLHEAWLLARVLLSGSSPKQEASDNPERRGRASGDKASRRCFDLLLFSTWLRGEVFVPVFCLGFSGLLALLACRLAAYRIPSVPKISEGCQEAHCRHARKNARWHWLLVGCVAGWWFLFTSTMSILVSWLLISLRDTDRGPGTAVGTAVVLESCVPGIRSATRCLVTCT